MDTNVLKIVRRLAFFLGLFGCFLPLVGRTQTLSILIQPQNQQVNYASDVSFSVSGNGTTSFDYQWLKNGVAIADYNNVSGSQTSMLHIVGVAENDVAGYSVVISNQSSVVTSSVALLAISSTIEFTENFESGGSNWNKMLEASPMALDNSQNTTPGGSYSLLATNSGQKMYHDLGTKYSCRLVFTFWMYDDGSALAGFGQLRGYTGQGYGRYSSPGGMVQDFVIGKANKIFSTNGVSGSISGEVLDTNFYQGHIMNGANAGWFNLNVSGAPNRTVGWHKFQIDRPADATVGGAVNFYVDGVLARSVVGSRGTPVNTVVLGTAGTGTNSSVTGNVWFDDVTVEAYPGLFDWQTWDSSGQSLFPDWMKLREVGTNAQVINDSVSTVATINGAATNDGLGSWITDSSGICASNIRGYLDYSLTAPAADAYRIEVEGREKDYLMPAPEMPVIVSIDGETLGRFNLSYGAATNGFVHCFTPYLKPGPHQVRLYWDNTSFYHHLYVQAVRLQSVAGGAVHRNGMKMWVGNRLNALCKVDVSPSSSPVSPACIEGRGQYFSMMNMTAQTSAATFNVPVHPGAGRRWYANVPLSVDSPTTITTSFQNGGTVQTNVIAWQVSNLLETNNITIRQGDSLLFGAAPTGATNGETIIVIAGVGSVTNQFDTPVPYEFDQPGTFSVTGIYAPTGISGTMTVNVVNASFDSPVPARVAKARYWGCTNLPPGVVIDADPRLSISPVTDSARINILPALLSKGTNEQDFWVRINSAESQYVLARLGPGGPILASIPVQGFRWTIAPETYLRIIGVNDDESQLIETAFVMSPMMPTLNVAVQIIVNGVTFDDGTVTKTLAAADFDATGITRPRFIRSAGVKASVCHTTHVYDGTVEVCHR